MAQNSKIFEEISLKVNACVLDNPYGTVDNATLSELIKDYSEEYLHCSIQHFNGSTPNKKQIAKYTARLKKDKGKLYLADKERNCVQFFEKHGISSSAVVGIFTVSCAVAFAHVYSLVLFGFVFYDLYRTNSKLQMIKELYAVQSLYNSHVKEAEIEKENVIKNLDRNLGNAISHHIEEQDNLNDKVLSRIDAENEKKLKHLEDNFNGEDYTKEAEEKFKAQKEGLESRLEENEEKLKQLKETTEKISEDLEDKRKECREVLEKIKLSYESLIPSFSEYKMLKSFFLGFDSNESPVLFDYNRESMLLCYQSTQDLENQSLMDTIIMICSQIMSLMRPTDYKINVVDNVTGGSSLAAFQMSSAVDENKKSSVFQIYTTSQVTQKLIDELHEEFLERKTRILGAYEDIDEFNDSRYEAKAKTEPYLFNIFFEYDYNIFKNEKLRQLCLIGPKVGILTLFSFDMTRIGDGSAVNKEKKYPYDISLLGDLNVVQSKYGFTMTDSVEIKAITEMALRKGILRR